MVIKRKIIFSTFAVMALMCAAHANQYYLEAGTGATLVGNTFQVNPGSGSFSVEIWYDATNETGRTVGTNLALAFDRTNQTFGTNVTRLDNILDVTAIDGDYTLEGHTAHNMFGFYKKHAATNRGANNNYAFAGGAALPFVASQLVAFDPGIGPDLDGAGLFRVAVATVTYQLAAGSTYGDDANEAGLFLANQGSTPTVNSGASGWVGSGTAPNGFKHAGSDKYAVAAVPEPTTMVAVVAGLAALARRRKK